MLESRYDAIIEKPTAIASGTNRLLSRALHEERGNEDRQHAEHREQARQGGLGRRVVGRLVERPVRGQCAWTFSIVTVASSTRMPTASASPPRVIRLIVWPVNQRAIAAASKGEGDVHHDDDGASPVAQEEQHHQPGQHGAEHAFLAQPVDGARHVGALVELVAHLHARRDDRLELRKVVLDQATTVSVDASARLVTGM